MDGLLTYRPGYIDNFKSSTWWGRSDFIPARIYTHILNCYCEAVSDTFLQCTKVYKVGHELEAPALIVRHGTRLCLTANLILNQRILQKTKNPKKT